MSRTPEGRIAEAIVAYLRRQPETHARRVAGTSFGTTGEPDVDAVIRGRAVKLEVKQPGREATLKPIQRVALNRWRGAGAVVGVVTGVDDVRLLLEYEGLHQGVDATDHRDQERVVERTLRLLETPTTVPDTDQEAPE